MSASTQQTGKFAELQRKLAANPQPRRANRPPVPVVLDEEIVTAARAAAMAASMFLKSGKSPSEALQATETMQLELLGDRAARRIEEAGDDYPAASKAISSLSGDASKDSQVLKNYLLRVILFVFEDETGGIYRVRAEHARRLADTIAGVLGSH